MFRAGDYEVNGMAYSMDFRVAAAKAYDECGSSAELAAALGTDASVATVRRATRRLDLTLKKSRPAPPSRTARTSGSSAAPGARGLPT